MMEAADHSAAMAAAIGRNVSTHWNLQRHAFSVKVSGRPVFLVPALRLQNCRFVVDERLRAQFEAQPTRRTVHALIKGTLVGYDVTENDGAVVRCNPFVYRGFVRAEDEANVVSADEVTLLPNRVILARGLVIRSAA
jgi:hypothetical protein